MTGKLHRFPVNLDLSTLGNRVFRQVVEIVLYPLVLHVIQLPNLEMDADYLCNVMDLSRLQNR